MYDTPAPAGDALSASYHILRREARKDDRHGAQGAYEVRQHLVLTQEIYGSEIDYANATRKPGILLSSLSHGARRGYLGSGAAAAVVWVGAVWGLPVKDVEYRIGSTVRTAGGAQG